MPPFEVVTKNGRHVDYANTAEDAMDLADALLHRYYRLKVINIRKGETLYDIDVTGRSYLL